ncbi:hypothetical protein [Pandoraea sp.]|uniref:hypothetical protein n=1 Tax=Pandoraea sp. TaxID=1883445 RepID=UPI0012014B1C|nr:hypothetical protein [Pandoraea sp.]TAL53207.1 MAG: hypothetical protein EPN80_16520 [Pandoraea sp.]TAM20585.1 MAG: hypothetical protein EPN65_00215 [Pandoraea sp.]
MTFILTFFGGFSLFADAAIGAGLAELFSVLLAGLTICAVFLPAATLAGEFPPADFTGGLAAGLAAGLAGALTGDLRVVAIYLSIIIKRYIQYI